MADLQPNRGFSGFSQSGFVYKNEVYSGPYHWSILQKAATGGGLSAITHFLQQAINHNEKELSRFDVRAVQITPTSQQESNTSFSSFNSNYIVSRLTASIVEIFGSEFKCGAKFFNNHLERCGDDVDLLLPSIIICDSNPNDANWMTGGPEAEKPTCDALQEEFSAFSFGNYVPSMEYVVTTTLLELIRRRWIKVLQHQEKYILNSYRSQRLSTSDLRLKEKEAVDEYLQRVVGLLRANLKIINRCRTMDGWLDGRYSDLTTDYNFMIDKVLEQMKRNASTIPVITAMMAGEESRQAIEQANDVKALTTLATIYIPLSFVAGLFGMNVTTFNPQINVPIWTYFAAAIPITIGSMVLVWYWTWVREVGPQLVRMTKQVKLYWQAKIRGEAVPKSAVMKGLVQVGGVFAAQGRPQLEDRINDELMNPSALEERDNFIMNEFPNRAPKFGMQPSNN